jgi:hypothetical protein
MNKYSQYLLTKRLENNHMPVCSQKGDCYFFAGFALALVQKYLVLTIFILYFGRGSLLLYRLVAHVVDKHYFAWQCQYQPAFALLGNQDLEHLDFRCFIKKCSFIFKQKMLAYCHVHSHCPNRIFFCFAGTIHVLSSCSC